MDSETVVRLLVAERAKALAFISSIVRRDELAEDVFQDVCVLALQKCESIKDELHFMKWLRTTGRQRSLQVLASRQARQLSLSDELLDLMELNWNAHDATDRTAALEALNYCMDLLPPRARDLVHKRYTHQVAYASLAAELKRPINSLYVTFSRIHAALADCVFKRLDGHHGFSGQ